MPPKTQTAQMDEIRELLSNPTVQRFAAEALEPLSKDGPLRALDTGQIILELADVVLTFRAPTLGEYRVLTEFDGETVTATDPPAEGEDVPAGDTMAPVRWWRKAAELLADHPLPPEDALPVWLANATYSRQAQNHWVMRPTAAPGT